MRTLALLPTMLGTLALASGVAGAAHQNVQSGTVFVTERTPGTSSVSAFDAASGEPLWTSPTATTPIGVTKPHGTGKVYTSDEGGNRMSVFGLRTGAALG